MYKLEDNCYSEKKPCELVIRGNMASVTKGSAFSEDQFGKKIDRCVTDTLVKTGMICSLQIL